MAAALANSLHSYIAVAGISLGCLIIVGSIVRFFFRS